MGEFLSLTRSHFLCTVEKEQSFYQAKTLFQNENKSDLECVVLIEKDDTSKRKPVLLFFFLKKT